MTGQPLDNALYQRVMEPLGMTDTAFTVPDSKLSRFAALYAPKSGGGVTLLDDPRTSKYRQPRTLLSGGGGLVSTAIDYLRIARLLANGGAVDGEIGRAHV